MGSDIKREEPEQSEFVINTFQEVIAYETLWAIEGMTEKKLGNLFARYDMLPSEVLRHEFSSLIEDERITKLKNDIQEFLREKLGSFSVSIYRDFQYPHSLRKAKYPIELFYYKGNLDLLNTKSVSIVGSRKVSDEGKLRAERLTRELVNRDYTIVSGLALGIDSQAHNTAIREPGGKTIGVIGTPINQYYPEENKEIQKKIAKDYLLISQVPFFRYEKEPFIAHKNNFPRRNVTMAAISEATIIVEASDTSGSLTQARACLHQEKKLFILDSCFHNKSIFWPAKYEKQGAIRVKNIDDILDNL